MIMGDQKAYDGGSTSTKPHAITEGVHATEGGGSTRRKRIVDINRYESDLDERSPKVCKCRFVRTDCPPPGVEMMQPLCRMDSTEYIKNNKLKGTPHSKLLLLHVHVHI